jgi:hypothetical protein
MKTGFFGGLILVFDSLVLRVFNQGISTDSNDSYFLSHISPSLDVARQLYKIGEAQAISEDKWLAIALFLIAIIRVDAAAHDDDPREHGSNDFHQVGLGFDNVVDILIGIDGFIRARRRDR